jgi:hypothetical protein
MNERVKYEVWDLADAVIAVSLVCSMAWIIVAITFR